VKAPAATTWAAVKVVFAISTGVDKGKVKESDGWAQRLLTRSRWTRFSTRLLCPAPDGIEALSTIVRSGSRHRARTGVLRANRLTNPATNALSGQRSEKNADFQTAELVIYPGKGSTYP
jgi:hypothetical protein